MNGEEIISKMMEIRERRNNEIQANGLEASVVDVQALIPEKEAEEKGYQRFLLIEEDTIDGKTVEIRRYYDESLNTLGCDRNDDEHPYPIPVEVNWQDDKLQLALKELKDLKDRFDLAQENGEGLISLEEMEQMILKEFGIEKADLEKLVLLDLTQEELNKIMEEDSVIEDKKELEESEELEIEDEEKENPEIEDPELEKKPKKEQLKQSDISASAIIEGKTYVNEYDTITSILKVPNEGFVKFAVVQSSQLKDNPNNSKYTFVGIRKDGSAKVLESDVLKPEMDDMGREDHELEEDGRIKENEGSRETFMINNSKYGFVLEGEGGKLEVTLMSRGKGRNGNESLRVPIRTYGLEPNERAVQQLNSRHPDDVDKGFDELKQNDDEGKVKTVEDVDGNPNTKSDTDWSSLVEELMEDKDVDAQFTSKEVREMIEKYWENGDTEEQIKYKIETDANTLENARDKNNH